MKPEYIIQQLEANLEVFRHLLSHKEKTCQGWRPAPDTWSLLEIVCHLYDEEREDFRTRVFHALDHTPGMPPSIDPPGWVSARKYNEQEYQVQLDAFLKERKKSITILKSVLNPDWESGFDHPILGRLTAYRLLSNWLAHDYHHIRQINRRLYEYLRLSSQADLSYAGDW